MLCCVSRKKKNYLSPTFFFHINNSLIPTKHHTFNRCTIFIFHPQIQALLEPPHGDQTHGGELGHHKSQFSFCTHKSQFSWPPHGGRASLS